MRQLSEKGPVKFLAFGVADYAGTTAAFFDIRSNLEEIRSMATYLLQLSYTPAAWAALVNSPQDRGEAVRGSIEKLGGEMTHTWLAFGEDDVVGILEMPDNVAAAAISMAFNAGGAIKNVKMTPLLSVKDGIEAMKKAAQCGYKPAQKAASA